MSLRSGYYIRYDAGNYNSKVITRLHHDDHARVHQIDAPVLNVHVHDIDIYNIYLYINAVV